MKADHLLKTDIKIVVLDSITHVTPDHRNHIIVAGSHGGTYSGWFAAQAGLRGVILHDAGVGLEQAGIACLDLLAETGMAAATAHYRSARIGDGDDMFARGVISFCNEIARALGVLPGMLVSQAAQCLKRGRCFEGVVKLRQEAREQLARDNGNGIEVVGIDSNSLVEPSDSRHIVVTGSHGGLLGGRPESAIRVAVRAAIYNDAGGGLDAAGYSRLPALNDRGIPAMTVYHTSARIGDARSSWATGIVSKANHVAANLGIHEGMAIRDAIRLIV